jgi:hypothetical protein
MQARQCDGRRPEVSRPGSVMAGGRKSPCEYSEYPLWCAGPACGDGRSEGAAALAGDGAAGRGALQERHTSIFTCIYLHISIHLYQNDR